MDNIAIMINHYKKQFKALEGNTVLISGATGLIGKNLIWSINEWNHCADNKIRVVAVVRNINKAKKLFFGCNNIEYIVEDILNISEKTLENTHIDYIIHAASQTSSKAFVANPVDTITVAVNGTYNMLKIAAHKKVKRFIFLSTMEVYGHPQEEKRIREDSITNIDTLEVRSCYPESKRLCESLCAAFSEQYNVPISVLRLTQTFGPGVEYSDGRVFAEFARAILENKDITLKTEGRTKRSYLHTLDAVAAIICCLNQKNKLSVFNVANEETYCSIAEMANFVIEIFSNNKLHLIKKKVNDNSDGFAPELYMNLDTSKIKAEGWTPLFNLQDMFSDMIDYMKTNNNK